MEGIGETEKLAMEIGRNFLVKKLQYGQEFSVLVTVGRYLGTGKVFQG